MASLDELQRKQAEVAKFAVRMAEEKDPERLKEMAEHLADRCLELRKAARGIEAAFAPPPAQGGEIRVVLTPAQKERLTGQTGVGIEAVVLRETAQRRWSEEMPLIDPREIEKIAAQQAAESRLQSETRTQVEEIIRQLDALEVPELQGPLAELRRDPTLGLGRKDR